MAKEFIPEDPKEVFAEFEKNPVTKVRVALQSYGSKDYVDIRNCWLDESNTWKLGKGFTINTEDIYLAVEHIDQIIEGLQKAREFLKAEEP